MPLVSLEPFRSRRFATMWAGALVSNIGTWMETVALGYYVADTTGRAGWSAVVAAAAFIPTGVLAPVGAAMADRLNRRRVLIVTQSLSALIAAVVALWVGGGDATPLGIAALGFLAGCVSAFGFPSFQTTLPELVPREQLVAAVGLSNAQWNLGRIIGPAFAAIALAVGGIGLALWINAVSFLAVIVAVVVAQVPTRRGEPRPVWQALGDGARFARGNARMRGMVVVMVAVVLLAAPFIAFVPQMATNVHNGSASATSLLVTAQGIGAVTAAFTLGAITHRFGLRRVMYGSSILLGPALVAYGAAPALWVAAMMLAVVGLAYGYAFTSFAGVTQDTAPAEMRGRALAVNSFVLGTMYPIGTLIQGVIADETSLRVVTMASGVALAAALLIRWWLPRREE
jgi:MFS family permease